MLLVGDDSHLDNTLAVVSVHNGPSWLDKHIAAQATYYGTTPERMTDAMNALATAQDAVERGYWPELY